MSNLIDDLDERLCMLEPGERYRLSQRFMIDALESISPALPGYSYEAIAVAKRFAEGRATVEELSDARVRCWKAVDNESDESNSDVSAFRAVICCLYAPDDRQDIYDLLAVFIDFAMNCGAREQALEQAMHTNFRV